MGMIANAPAANGSANMQPKAEKDQASGYVGIGFEGQVALGGKVGFNGVTPVGKATDSGASATGISISLLEALSINTPLNNHAAQINAIRKCLRDAGLMA